MKLQFLHRRLAGKRGWWVLAGLAIVVVAGLAAASRWSPEIRELAASTLARFSKSSGSNKAAHWEGDGHDHGKEAASAGHGDSEDEHDHANEAPGAHAEEGEDHDRGEASHAESKDADHKHDEAEAVKLTRTAQLNVGLQLAKVEVRPFERTLTIPGMVVERPGRSEVQIGAPLTGVVTRIWPLQGETVAPGQPLFDLRLTHEEVVEAQAEFLRTAEELDVVQREIDRLAKVSSEGAIAAKTLLERKYEQQKLQGVFRAQRQRLLLHGLSSNQIDEIISKRSLLGTLTVFVPDQTEDGAKSETPKVLQVEELKVTQGQHVKAGDPLCTLADYSRLYIQGKAFEQDGAVLDKAATNDWRVTAVVEGSGQERQTIEKLPIVYLANKVEPESRAFLFYVELPNNLTRNRQTANGHRFSGWKFKPGQRVQLLVPAEQWPNRIVLPLNAVVQDGAEAYVFEKNDGHFDRRSVRVEYRDQYSVVVANDDALTPGKMVIVSGAYQVHLAMKNKAGGAPDPHAGHNH